MSKFTAVRDTPTRITIPENAPPYFHEYVKSVEEHAKLNAEAIRQLQSKVSTLEEKVVTFEKK